MQVEQLEGATHFVSGRELSQQNSLLTSIPNEVEHTFLGNDTQLICKKKGEEEHAGLNERHVREIIKNLGPGIVLEVLDQIGIKGIGSHEAQLPKKGPILLEKEPFVDDLFSTENCFFPSSNITEMEMGTGVRTEISSAKDDVAIYFGSEVLGGEDNNLPMVIYDIEGAGINSAETDKIDLQQGFCSSEQITLFAEPLPLQINDSLSEQEIEDKASLWVHSNVLKLSQLFGVACEGCDKAAFDLFLRIDQKRGDLRQKKVETTPIKAKNTIPKVIRNLEFQVKFKEGESRNKGRISNTNFR
ncbi:hypothetical protein MTR67_036091 [Solanum verrucosum]|uniref:Uncharacterized protein n=1 Tax=Solanum verrucosum TaxID=315347 RepID=A0AAF0ZKK8_SOLVR|nr:hypothetical protein MTR67_036091 [Solanum verrucosum]